MSFNKEILEKNQVKFTVDVKTEDWTNALDEAFKKTKHKFNIPGFRKGKVPKNVIINMYGTGVFYDDALDIVLPNVYGEILDSDKELYPVARPDIDVLAISDTTLKLSIIITVKPEVKLGDYKGLTIEKNQYPVTDEMINEELKRAQEKQGAWETISDRAALLGDKAVIDFSGSVDGVKFEGGTAEKYSLELGSGMFIPGFEEQVVGMNIGDEKDITVTFPDGYQAEDLAGKEAVFAVKLHELSKKDLPALDDKFAQDASEFNTLEEYKADIRKGLETVNADKAKRELENKMMEIIADNAEIEIPDAMIEQQVEEMIQEFEYRLMYQGMKAEDYYKYTNSSREELAVKYNSVAAKNVKIRLVMEAIIKAENITVSEAEIDERLVPMAENAKSDLAEYKAKMQPNQLAYFENEIVTDKLMNFLMENNKIA